MIREGRQEVCLNRLLPDTTYVAFEDLNKVYNDD